ncbi:MAG: hypothetical protein ABW171_02590 [Steroidobacter sp.]
MHSSTSSSDATAVGARSTTARVTVLLLVAIVALCVVLELGTRMVVHGMSNTLSRIRTESTAARTIAATNGGEKQMLIVGNSLMLAGIDVGALNEPLQPAAWRGVRFGIEQTTYYDWYYGLKRLTTEGSRPSAILVCFEPRHLVGTSVRREIFAYYLMRTSDTLDVARVLDLRPSETADLFLANVSAFWALRKEIRKNVLGRLMPSLPDLTRLMTRGGGSPPPNIDDLLTAGRPRLEAMRDTADAAGAKLILVLMPPVDAAYSQALRQLGQELNVPIVMPLTDQDLNPDDYEPDQYHLNAGGRLRFTQALAHDLLEVLPRP